MLRGDGKVLLNHGSFTLPLGSKQLANNRQTKANNGRYETIQGIHRQTTKANKGGYEANKGIQRQTKADIRQTRGKLTTHSEIRQGGCCVETEKSF